MELVYIWVEKYKNIVMKGFNLSPKFKCKFEPNYLTIEKKEYHNIFPKNINIIAFIGANGCGKTSLLEIIQLLCLDSVDVSQTDEYIWGIFYDKVSDKFYCESLVSENTAFDSVIVKDINGNDITEHYKSNRTIELENSKFYFYNVPNRTFYNIFYNPSIELISSKFLNYINNGSKEFYGHIFDLDFKPPEINIFAFPSKVNGIINIRKNENNIILNMFKMVGLIQGSDIKKRFDSDKVLFIPKRIQFSINFDDLEYNIKQEYIRKIVLQNSLTLNIKDLYRYYLAMIFSSIRILKKDNQGFTVHFLKDESVITTYLIEKYKKIAVDYTDYHAVLKIIYEDIYANINDFMEVTKDISLYNSLRDDSILNFNVNEISKLIDTMRDHGIKTFPNNTSEVDYILPLLKNLPTFISVEVYDENRALFSDFSYGEKNFIQLFYSLLYYVTLFGKNKIINIVLDEIELGLNPKWQKKLIKTLLNLLESDMLSNMKFNIFLSSHSPFVLSDLPKQNVVFLKNGEEDSPFLNDQNTFGSNIHTLLSHGFFMENGLMGEYAKEKITEIFEYLKDNKPLVTLKDEDIKSIIDLIGEDFLKQKLLSMYYVKFPDAKEQRIQELKAELESLG